MATATAQREKTVTVQLDDPFNSLFTPSFEKGAAKSRNGAAFASAEINSSHKAQTYLPPSVQPTFSDPLLQPHSTLSTNYTPKGEYIKARRSARDAWFAVMFLGGVVAMGTYWVVDRVGSDAAKINTLGSQVNDLNRQLTGERGVVLARNKEIELLNDQLGDERAKTAKLLKTAAKK
jgi:hypothetical protein